ncbi:MAG: O-antigen ligase family protein [Clostridia bacterium]|nr:O-antigen ligase family protein [Clostridia bacterium]
MIKAIDKREGGSFFDRSISITFIIDALILLYTVSVYLLSFDVQGNVISRLLAFALMGMISIYILMSKKIILNGITIWFGAFIVFCLLSSLWAINISLATERVFTLVQLFILSVLLYNYLYKENKVDYYIKVLCWSGVIFAVYTVLYFGVEAYFAGLEEGERMGGEITNVNTIGLATATAALICLWNVFYNNKKWYLIPTVICTIVALGSGSRKVLVLLFLGIALLFVLKGDSKKKIVSILQGIGVLIVLILVLQMPIFDTITSRMEGLFNMFTGEGSVESSANDRMIMIKIGLEKFLQDPFKGVGIGNSGYIVMDKMGRNTYLHNNYIELLASVGIFGTLLYYGMYFATMPQIFKSASKQDRYSILVLTILMLQLVIDYAAVQYYEKTPYLYIVLFFLIADKEKEKIKNVAKN